MKTPTQIIEHHGYADDCTPNYIDEIESLMIEYSKEIISKDDLKILKESLNGLEELCSIADGWEKDRDNMKKLILKLEKLPIS